MQLLFYLVVFYRMEDTPTLLHILQHTTQDQYHTFITRYSHMIKTNLLFSILRKHCLWHEYDLGTKISFLTQQVVTTAKELITHLYFENDVPQSYENYVIGRDSQFPTTMTSNKLGRTIIYNIVMDQIWYITWSDIRPLICRKSLEGSERKNPLPNRYEII